jgi:antitoxin CptB
MAFHNPISSPIAQAMADSDSRRKRALYRAHHRGTKEMDLILGGFADAELAELSQSEVAAFELLLALPDPEIEQVINGAPPPPDLARLFKRIKRRYGLEG